MLAPRIDPKYEIVRKLREGGMGAIYLVRHRLLDELRVVKVLRSQLNTDEDLRQRFLREAKTAIQLRHPNIAQLYDFSVDEEGNASIVLEYIDGLTLEEFGRQGEARDLGLDLAIARQALRALGFLHRKGFVHRDIAPDNLMLTRDHEGEPLVKLIDLGIVKILKGEGKGTATSLYLGKPRYSSPEQLTSPEIDARSDLYSFGVMLYELVTGCYPIRGHDLASLIAAHLHLDPVPFDVSDPQGRVPAGLRQVLLGTMAKSPDQRPASAEELAARLDEIAARLPPHSRGEYARLIESARDGARSRRESALAEAIGEVRAALAREAFSAARQRLTAAVGELGNDPELLELGRRIEEQERARRVADAESERFERLLAAAQAAFEAGDVPGALSQITEVLARRPDEPRARSLAARIDARRREDEARAAAGEERGGTLAAGRSGAVSMHDAPTAEVPIVPLERPPAAPDAAPRGTAPRPLVAPAPAPRGGGALRGAAVAGLLVAVAAGGWLLWRGMSGGASGGGTAADPGPAGYREGLTALAADDPATAAQRLRAALAEDATERAGYLPWFHLGQALVARGQCEEGLKALDASERQGALAGTPEAALLPALRASCSAAPEVAAELVPVDEAIALLERQIAEIEGSKTSSEVAAMWASKPQLAADFEAAKKLVADARALSARARVEKKLDLAFQAGDAVADARAKLAAVLRAASGG